MKPTAIELGNNHAEAFCLMPYHCQNCHHSEWLWNSRDGVTPFGLNCPQCGKTDFLHNIGGDIYAKRGEPVNKLDWYKFTLKEHGDAWLNVLREQYRRNHMGFNPHDFQPHVGMIIWIDMSLEHAASIIQQRMIEHPEYLPAKFQEYQGTREELEIEWAKHRNAAALDMVTWQGGEAEAMGVEPGTPRGTPAKATWPLGGEVIPS